MKNKTLLFLILTILTVFIFFQHTLHYAVKAYDELAPFLETHVPACFSLSEIFELISNLGLHQHFESSNVLYSNIVSLRCDPLCAFLHLITQYICQKNSFYYHLYGLILHLINTTLVFLIINKISLVFSHPKENANSTLRLFTVSLLTIFWATHPVNIESVLLLTNANIMLSYGLGFLAFYLCLNSDVTLFKSIFLFLIFGLVLFIAEFHFMLPIIVLVYLIAMNKSSDYKKIFLSVIPLFVASLIFIVSFLLSNTKMSFETHSSIKLILERVFWLSPQILFHFFKLLFLPIKLSIDQTLLVNIGKSLFDPYAIFCIVFILLILILSFYKSNKKISFFFIIFFLLLLSLVPYSQILAPIYNIASERYLYFPSFILIFGFSHFVFEMVSHRSTRYRIYTLGIFLVVLCIFSTRSYIRTLDWKDNISLYKSAIGATDNPLYKAFRYRGLIPQEKIFLKSPELEVDIKYQKLAYNLLQKAIINLRNEKEKYEQNTPAIVKNYGLDPATLLTKAGLFLSTSEYNTSKDPKNALKIIEPYTKDLSLFNSIGLSFYGSLLFYNDRSDKAEEILRYAYKKFPYSTRIAFQLCDLIQIKNGSINEIERIALREFKYFPYDSFVLLALTKVYELKGNQEKYAHFSYIYGLRQHSLQDLNNAYQTYLKLNRPEKAEEAKEKILDTIKNLKKRKYIS